MKRKTIGIGIGALFGVLLLVLGGIWYYIQTSAFMDKVESTASTVASETLGVPVSVGAIKVNSLHDLEIHDLAIYDKQAECIAQADTAVSSSKFAVKCEQAGVDAIVAEGFEAGGHNGREETTTLCLIPAVRRATTLPLIAAGGIGTGNAMLATFALGAEGVQIGTRFALTEESSAHENFKQLCLNLNEGDTKLLLKKLSPTRLVKGEFTTAVEEAEARGASAEEMKELLGKGRSKKGIFEGNLQEGELEIGQVASLFREMQTVSEVMKEIMEDFRKGMEKIQLAL